MICSICGKNAARTYVHKTEEGERKLTLCPACYAKLYGTEGTGETDAVCSVCGTTFSDYRATGLVGCENCYNDLRELLLPGIMRYHGHVRHYGKTPAGGADESVYERTHDLAREATGLREKLRAAVAHGDTAEAARCRSRLNEINRILSGGDA